MAQTPEQKAAWLAKTVEQRKQYFKDYRKRPEARRKEADNQNLRKAKKKQQAVDYLGGCCQRCEGVFPLAVYDFHHKYPSEKEFNVAHLLHYTWARVTPELDKCILLCANCHRIIHSEAVER